MKQVEVKVFTDFACPFCYVGHKMIEKIKSGEKIGGVDKAQLEDSFKSNPELLKKINDMLS